MHATPELHVVYGNGPVGTAVVAALLQQGTRVRVVTRSGARKDLPPAVEVVRGDATDPADARRACAGASHVYHCTNPADYHRWPAQFPPLQRGVLAGAATHGAKLIAMENLYLYGPHGRAMVAVGADDAALGQAWHVPNAPAVTLRAFVGLVCAEAGVPPRLSAVPRPLARALLPLLGLVVPPLRGVGENAYIFYEPYVVDHSKYAQALGDHATPLADAVRETVRWYRAQAAPGTALAEPASARA